MNKLNFFSNYYSTMESTTETSVNRVLADLLEYYADKRELVRLITEIMNDDDNFDKHYAFRTYINVDYNTNVWFKIPALNNYRKEYHRHMYGKRGLNKVWFDGKLQPHCEEKGPDGLTLPAEICSDGTMRWFSHGQVHREDKDENGLTLPACICPNGSKYWYRNGQSHRDDKDENGRTLPATIYSDSSMRWCRNGSYHRDDKDENGHTLPASITENASKQWYQDGDLHRADLDADKKAMPAEITSCGKDHYFYKGEMFSQERLTKKLLKKTMPRNLEITTAAGNKLTIMNIVQMKYV
jgi:hypothetical protein